MLAFPTLDTSKKLRVGNLVRILSIDQSLCPSMKEVLGPIKSLGRVLYAN